MNSSITMNVRMAREVSEVIDFLDKSALAAGYCSVKSYLLKQLDGEYKFYLTASDNIKSPSVGGGTTAVTAKEINLSRIYVNYNSEVVVEINLN